MSDLNPDDVAKMKVAELRTALGDYGLDTKGTKPILVARLQSYLESQPSQDAGATGEEKSAEPGKNLLIFQYNQIEFCMKDLFILFIDLY